MRRKRAFEQVASLPSDLHNVLNMQNKTYITGASTKDSGAQQSITKDFYFLYAFPFLTITRSES